MQETYIETGFVRLCFEKLFWLIDLNIVFILCCIPIVTIPAAITALCCGCQKLLLDEPGVVKSFFHSLRHNFFPAIPVGLLFVAGPVLLLWLCIFYFQASKGEGVAVVLSIFCLVCVYALYCIGSFAFQMLARVELSISAVLQNAFFLTFGQPRIFLGWLVFSFISLIVCVLMFPYSFPWIALLGASLPCFSAARGILPVLDRLIVKE